MNKVLFFAFKGFIYSYYEYNPQIIYPDDDPEEILDELINKYRNLQKELDRDDFEKKQEIKKEFFKKLEDEVSRSDIFKTLTNATGRKDYVFGLALEHNPDFYLEYSVMMKDLSKITERVWKKYKFSLIK